MNTHSTRVVAFPDNHGSARAKRRHAYARFRDALRDFSDRPTSDSARRYLAASRSLDESCGVRSKPALSESDSELPPAA
jgi:hypothetical protein